MSTFLEIRNLVLQAIARNDLVAVAMANAAINYAVAITSLSFKPPEMLRESDVILTGNSNVLFFPYLVNDVDIDDTNYIGSWRIDEDGALTPIGGSTLSTYLLDVIKVYNKTLGHKLDFVPYESWEKIVPVGTVTKYWTLFGQTLYVSATPTTSIMLKISYSMYPAPLVNNIDVIPFDHHDPFIVSVATSICWAAFEETDSSTLWTKIAGMVGDPQSMSTKERAIIEGQKVLLENAVNAIKGE